MPDICQELDYVTASQGQIYIDGILIDEVYDIQYTYREFKEPIYGYNSKHFVKVLPGTVIIHGQFSINYRHDSYLQSIFEKIRTETTNSGIGISASVSQVKKMVARANEQAKNYKATLQAIRDGEKNLKDLKTGLDNAKAASRAATLVADKTREAKDIVAAKHEFNAEKAREDYDVAMGQIFDDDPKRALEIERKQNEYDAKREEIVAIIKTRDEEISRLQTMISDSGDELKAINLEIQTNQDLIGSNAPGRNQKQRLNELLIERDRLNKKIGDMGQEMEDAKKAWTSKISQAQNEADAIVANTGIWPFNNTDGQDFLKRNQDIREAEMRQVASEQNMEKASDDADWNDIDSWAAVSEKTTELAEATKDLAALKDKIKGMKENMMDVSGLMLDAIKNEKASANSKDYKRPEDELAFNIFFNYNGITHKILQECTLTGHTHAVQQGGEAVREYYSFIAKKVI